MKVFLVALAVVAFIACLLVSHTSLASVIESRLMAPVEEAPAQLAGALKATTGQKTASAFESAVTKTVVSPDGDALRLERAIMHRAEKERWWMLFVGITLVGYRLLRKHQALFAHTLLYSAYEGAGGDFEGDWPNNRSDIEDAQELSLGGLRGAHASR